MMGAAVEEEEDVVVAAPTGGTSSMAVAGAGAEAEAGRRVERRTQWDVAEAKEDEMTTSMSKVADDPK
jgi:hypothetical protein